MVDLIVWIWKIWKLGSLKECVLCVHLILQLPRGQEEKHFYQAFPLDPGGHHTGKPCDTPRPTETPFIFPHTRSRPSLPPAMPTLPEEEEDSPEELDSSSSSPSTVSAHFLYFALSYMHTHVSSWKLTVQVIHSQSDTHSWLK